MSENFTGSELWCGQGMNFDRAKLRKSYTIAVEGSPVDREGAEKKSEDNTSSKGEPRQVYFILFV